MESSYVRTSDLSCTIILNPHVINVIYFEMVRFSGGKMMTTMWGDKNCRSPLTFVQ